MIEFLHGLNGGVWDVFMVLQSFDFVQEFLLMHETKIVIQHSFQLFGNSNDQLKVIVDMAEVPRLPCSHVAKKNLFKRKKYYLNNLFSTTQSGIDCWQAFMSVAKNLGYRGDFARSESVELFHDQQTCVKLLLY